MRTSYAAGIGPGQLARRLPRHPQGRALPRVPARRVQRDDGLARRERRAGRDLERHAVLLAGLGADPAARRVAAPRPRLDVGDDAAAPARAARAARSSSASRRRSTAARAIVTLSESSKDEIVRRLRLRPSNITVVPPGHRPVVLARRHARSVAARGRGRPARAGEAVRRARSTRSPTSRRGAPDLRAVIVGEGYERDALERRIAEVGADDWISLPGRVDDATLLDLYRRAWVLASASRARGLGDDDHRGGRVRHARGRHSHRRPQRRGRRRRLRRARRRATRRSRPHSNACCATTRSARAARRRTRSSTRRTSRGPRLRAGRSKSSRPRRCRHRTA